MTTGWRSNYLVHWDLGKNDWRYYTEDTKVGSRHLGIYIDDISLNYNKLHSRVQVMGIQSNKEEPFTS